MARYLSPARIEGPIWLEPSYISFLRAGISNAEIQHETLDRQISELTRQKDAKLIEIKSLKNILASVRRIPAEVLSDIFQPLCLPEEGIPIYEHDIVVSLSILSAVCVAWRTAVRGTPRLRSKLCLKYHEPSILEPDWVKEWIDRSRAHSLDLCLDFDKARSRSGVSPARLGRFMETVLTFGHKLRFLNLKGPISLFTPLLSLQSSSLPQLEQIYLNILSFQALRDGSIDVRTAYRQLPHEIEMLSGASKLRYVDFIERDDCTSLLKRLVLPVEQLNTLKISSTIWRKAQHDPDVYVNILRRCKGLVHLRVNLPRLDLKPNHILLKKRLSISLLSLKSLDISAHDTCSLNLLNCLFTPLLEELTLRHNSQDLTELIMNVTSFQHRSATTLSSLTLQAFGSFDVADESMAQGLVGLFSLFPTITSLWMKSCSFNMNPLLRAMTFTQSHSALLPKLTTLEFGLDTHEEYYSELIPMILSRYWADITQSVCNTGCDLLRLQKVNLWLQRIEEDEFTEITKLPGLIVDIDLL